MWKECQRGVVQRTRGRLDEVKLEGSRTVWAMKIVVTLSLEQWEIFMFQKGVLNDRPLIPSYE